MGEQRQLLDTGHGAGMRVELYQLTLKKHSIGRYAAGTPEMPGGELRLYETNTARQVRFVLEGGGVLLEPGALQWSRGRLTIEIQKSEGTGGVLRRRMTSAGTGEAAFATRYTGHGEVWTEPTQGYFIVARMDGPADALILDDGAFYACEGTITVGVHRHRSVSGVMSGAGFAQPKISGSGVFVVESPVPVEEIEAVELDGSDEMIVDGDVLLMYSASLNVELRPLVRGLRNVMRSGEGLVFKINGRGNVWLTPTSRIQP